MPSGRLADVRDAATCYTKIESGWRWRHPDGHSRFAAVCGEYRCMFETTEQPRQRSAMWKSRGDINFYVSVFYKCQVGHILREGKSEEPDKAEP